MPESPELDEVARKIAEAKQFAREVEGPGEDTGTVDDDAPADEEDVTPS